MTISEAARKVIDLSRKVRDYYDAELPKWHPNYPLIRSDEKSAPPPAEEKELRALLASLSDKLIYQLLLIMYLGRGDFNADELVENYKYLKDTFAHAEHAISQMMEKAPLADYLSDGLEELRKHDIDADRLPLKKAKLRKQ